MKKNVESSKIFVKIKFSKLINYSPDMCRSYQSITMYHFHVFHFSIFIFILFQLDFIFKFL
jgi:hypothetical protein